MVTDNTDTAADIDPLRVRKPPVGLTRAERRDWREDEAVRVAGLRDQARTNGFRAVRASAPPRSLGRRGRRVWREADRANRVRRLDAEAASSESDRYVGALVLMATVGVVIAMQVLFAGGGDGPQPPNPPPATVIYVTSTTPVSPVLPPRGG